MNLGTATGFYPASQIASRLWMFPPKSFTYMQVKNLVTSLQRMVNILRSLTGFEELFIKPQKNVLSKVYSVLLSTITINDTVKFQWEYVRMEVITLQT